MHENNSHWPCRTHLTLMVPTAPKRQANRAEVVKRAPPLFIVNVRPTHSLFSLLLWAPGWGSSGRCQPVQGLEIRPARWLPNAEALVEFHGVTRGLRDMKR